MHSHFFVFVCSWSFSVMWYGMDFVSVLKSHVLIISFQLCMLSLCYVIYYFGKHCYVWLCVFLVVFFYSAFVSPTQTIKCNLLMAFMTSHCNKVYHNAFYCFFEVCFFFVQSYVSFYIFHNFKYFFSVCNTSCCRLQDLLHLFFFFI